MKATRARRLMIIHGAPFQFRFIREQGDSKKTTHRVVQIRHSFKLKATMFWVPFFRQIGTIQDVQNNTNKNVELWRRNQLIHKRFQEKLDPFKGGAQH